jgi:cell division protein FtsB
MDTQSLLNLLFSSAGLILGWFLRELWAAVKDLKADLAKLREELPKEYLTKNDYREDVKELKDMISKLFDILENRRGILK